MDEHKRKNLISKANDIILDAGYFMENIEDIEYEKLDIAIMNLDRMAKNITSAKEMILTEIKGE